ncbi:hypothetical protein DFR70_103687 [Nocardia tenerifensis]|uniref:Uncharacterized protein n=1 Tax=Nocardia tenerifensis TaxID=228006 RepID=A0A318K9J8_9NOCA|nr:hypothetical protein [Nocardia tenerifensis]PXX66932.1 hypothetical protein DFR70_103687 [Nocardia tenerifensis]
MRNRPEHHHNDDPDDNHTPPPRRAGEPREPGEPTAIRDILAAEFADYLADVVAKTPPPDNPDDTTPTPPARPNLRLITTTPDKSGTADWDEPLTVDDAITAARTARRKVVRGAAGGTAVVVTAGVVAGWGEPLIVTGPLAIYGTGWLGYLWWNAALRPTLGQILAAVFGGLSTACAVVLTTLATLARGLVERVDTARSRHETTRTATTSPSA